MFQYIMLILSAAPLGDLPEDVQLRAIEQRRNLSSGSVVIDVKSEFNHVPNPYKRQVRYEIVYAGESVKQTKYLDAVVNGAGAVEGVRMTEIRHEDKRISYALPTSPSPSGLPYVAQVEPLDRGKPRFLDPRVLGMIPKPFATLYNVKFDVLMSGLPLTTAAPQVAEIDGVARTLVSIETADRNTKTRLWFAPEMDDSLVKLEREYDTPEGRELCQMIIAPENWGTTESPKWYPKHVLLEQLQGEAVKIHEEITVVSANFDPVDPAEFTVERMDLPVNTPVVDARPGKQSTSEWDGQQLKQLAPMSARGETLVAPPRPRWVWWLVGAGWLLLASICFFGFWQSRTPTKEK